MTDTHTKHCCHRISWGDWGRTRSCGNAVKITRDGKGYCLIHDPVRVEKKRIESVARREKKNKERFHEFSIRHAANDMYRVIKAEMHEHDVLAGHHDLPKCDCNYCQQLRPIINKIEGSKP